jgi:MFS family permease
VIGFGQVSGAITTQVLVQQHAPEHIRGSVIGMFGVCGGVGIMVATWMGGIAFDSWAEQSPFVVLGIANGVVAIVAIALHRRIGAPPT